MVNVPPQAALVNCALFGSTDTDRLTLVVGEQSKLLTA